MLLLASDTARGTQSLIDVVREMSFSVSYFASPKAFADLMGGPTRRIVFLSESDVNQQTVEALDNAVGRASFGLIIAANQTTLRSVEDASVIDGIVKFGNVEWIGRQYDFERFAEAARKCRRRMLTLSREDIENAFTDSEFVLRYQPKVERNSGSEWRTHEAEALVRWRHPIHGHMGPLEFLPEVEAFGMMHRLSEFVLKKSAEQLSAWRKQGLALNACVNLAPSLLNNNELGERYEQIVRDIGLEPKNFTFEVVEQDLRNPNAPHLRTLADMRARGFRLCLDDFRVAASSLSTFEKLPFDEIKIHAMALKRAQQDPIAMQVLAALTGLAHNLGMTVCAEGVEDEKTFEFLKTIECDKMQGFLISEAVLPNIIQQVYTPTESTEDAA